MKISLSTTDKLAKKLQILVTIIMSESKIVLVHLPDGKFTLKQGGVTLEGVKSVKRSLEDGMPVVEVEALLAAKQYENDAPAAMVLVVDKEGNESLRHGDQPLAGALEISESDGVLKLKFAVASEDYAPLRAAKKAAPKAAEEKKVVAPKPEPKKTVVEKPEDK